MLKSLLFEYIQGWHVLLHEYSKHLPQLSYLNLYYIKLRDKSMTDLVN